MWRRANFQARRRTLWGFCTCRIAPGAPLESQRCPNVAWTRTFSHGASSEFCFYSVRDRRPFRGFGWAAALARGRPQHSCGFGRAAALAHGVSFQNSVRNRRPSHGFRRAAAMARGASSEFCLQRRPSRGFRRVATLARRASSEFSSQLTTISCFSAGGASSEFCSQSMTPWFSVVLGILLAIADPLVLFAGQRHWRVEHPRSSARDGRPSVVFSGWQRWRVEHAAFSTECE